MLAKLLRPRQVQGSRATACRSYGSELQRGRGEQDERIDPGEWHFVFQSPHGERYPDWRENKDERSREREYCKNDALRDEPRPCCYRCDVKQVEQQCQERDAEDPLQIRNRKKYFTEMGDQE